MPASNNTITPVMYRFMNTLSLASLRLVWATNLSDCDDPNDSTACSDQRTVGEETGSL